MTASLGVLQIESASPAAAEKQPLLAVPETPRGEKSHKLSFAEAPGVTPPRSFDRQRPEMFTVEDQTLPQPAEQSQPQPVEQTLQTAGEGLHEPRVPWRCTVHHGSKV